MDKLERPQKRIKVKASKNDSTLTALATNVSSMGNQFGKAINQISNTVHHSVDAVRQMNRILESMLEKSVDIHVRVTRCRVCVGQVNICVDVCNKSPLPLVRGGILKVELTPISAVPNDDVFCKISIPGNESKESANGKIEMNETKDIYPKEKIAYKFLATFCPPGKFRYRGKISFSFKSPGNDSTLSNAANFCVNRIQQLHPTLCVEKDKNERSDYLKKIVWKNIPRQTNILNAKCEMEYLRELLGIHATQPIVVNNGLYRLDKNMHVLLKTDNKDLKIGDAIDYFCSKNGESFDISTEDSVYVYFLSDDSNRNKNMQNEFRVPWKH